MISTIQVLISLLGVVAAVAVVANRLEIPPAILLVLAGVLLALVPGLPPLELAPELVLLLILPPIIYTSAFLMSWREFQYNLRAITLLSVGGVVFTTLAVAAAAHWLMDQGADQGFDPQPFHLDEDAALHTIFGGLAASGWHACVQLDHHPSFFLQSRERFHAQGSSRSVIRC